MYSIIRIIITIIVFIFIARICKPKKKRMYFLIIVSALCFCTVLEFLPIENLFIDFQYPQQVINYLYPSSERIADVVYDEKSCMVILEKSKNNYTNTYLGTDNNSYKITTVFDYSTESQYDDRYVNLSITHITNSSDYYLCGTYYFGEDIQTIKDTSDSDIKFIPIGVINSKQSSKVYKSYLIYGTINSYTKNYSLEINNQTIVFN